MTELTQVKAAKRSGDAKIKTQVLGRTGKLAESLCEALEMQYRFAGAADQQWDGNSNQNRVVHM